MFIENIKTETVVSHLKEKINEIKDQPEFQWSSGRTNYAVTEDGEPDVKVGIANCHLDFDLWKGLRNPAKIGLYPVGLEQIWELWAASHIKKTDERGHSKVFKILPSYDSVKDDYKRAVIISVMLPVSPGVLDAYYQCVLQKRPAPYDVYSRVKSELDKMLNISLGRLAFDLMDRERAVIAMTKSNVEKISTQTIPLTHQKDFHGPSKRVNYPQKSIAVLTGLGQFGVSRLVIRDEFKGGRVKRYIGSLCSIIIFDRDPLVTDGQGGILNLTEEWREKASSINDFTNTDPEINRYRYCTYIPQKGEKGCSLCVKHCPSGALANSSPEVDGHYPERVKDQNHRFWEDTLQFDYSRCIEERKEMVKLYDEWECGTCFSICGIRGNKRKAAAEKYQEFVFGSR